MIQSRNCLGFALESLLRLEIVRNMFGKNLDGNGAVQPSVSCLIDFAHSAGAQARDDFVTAHPSSNPRRSTILSQLPRGSLQRRLIHETANALFGRKQRFDLPAQFFIALTFLSEKRQAQALSRCNAWK